MPQLFPLQVFLVAIFCPWFLPLYLPEATGPADPLQDPMAVSEKAKAA